MTVITEVQKFMKIVKNENDLKRNFFKIILKNSLEKAYIK
jgi:hypothetical protein